MAFHGLTPESLLARSDSKNPATTCKGITKLGRPCRNPLSLDPTKAARFHGVIAVASVASDSDDEEIGAAAFFCHKHQDQAERLVAANTNAGAPQRQDTHIYPLQNRSSIDTLVERLGVLEVEEPAQASQRRKREKRDATTENRPPRRVKRPSTWDAVHGPLMEVPGDLMKQGPAQGRPQKKKAGFWQSLCCGASDDDYVEVVRHRKRVQNQAPPMSQHVHETPTQPSQPQQSQTSRPYSTSRPPSAARPVSNVPARKPLSEKPARPVNTINPQPTSATLSLLSYIPKSLSPQTTSLLVTELSKPISPHDEEGYIYIFWLTPESAGPAPSSTASALLAPPSRPEHGRRTSDVLRQYSVHHPRRPSPNRPRRRSAISENEIRDKNSEPNGAQNTIFLKIGRANNVHRRMNEWNRQCGYSLSLVRFYPYVPSTPSPSPHPSPRSSPAQARNPLAQNIHQARNQRPTDNMRRASSGVRKVPHAHRVERLIHIELNEQRTMKKCDACGKDHREWFEVEASREGVRKVDEVVRRWVEWAERAPTS